MPEHCVAPGVHAGFAGHEQLPHAHVALHVSDPYVLQVCVAFFAHAPWLEHVPLVCQAPLALQVCVSVPQLPQAAGFVWPGAHTPAQVPVPVPDTHVLLVHATVVVPHCPQASHVCTPLPEHRVAAGVHTGVDGHEQVPHPQVPQVCVPYELHVCVAFRVHAPEVTHAPLVCQAPLALQVWMSVPQVPQATGFVWPGAHTPVQVPVPVPDTHVVLVHATVVVPHCPQASQVWTPLPEHRVAPAVHTDAAGQEQALHPQVELHDCVPYVLQLCVAFGAHVPWLAQVPLLCHTPPAPQVCVSVPQLPQAAGFV